MTQDGDEAILLGGANIYADLGIPNAEGMFLKAQLAMQIADAIKARHLTQSMAAAEVGLSQPKLSGVLRGHFHGVSETKMMDCLAALGKNVEIAVRAAPRGRAGVVRVVSKRPVGRRKNEVTLPRTG